MAKEGVQQYRDYYEDDPEEQSFFEYLDNLTNRDQIRFMECFFDWTTVGNNNEGYNMIPKREFNPEISAFSNALLDLVDFKDRVRPMANDLSRHDASLYHQKRNPEEVDRELAEEREEIKAVFLEEMESLKRQMVDDGDAEANAKFDAAMASLKGETFAAEKTVEEGYSSVEIPAESGADSATEEPAAEEADAAEPNLEASMETSDETTEEKQEEDEKKE